MSDDKVISFKDNPIKKANQETAEVKKVLAAVQQELAHYKGIMNYEKSISDMLRLQVIDLESNMDTLKAQLNTVDNNLKGIKIKLAQINNVNKKPT